MQKKIITLALVALLLIGGVMAFTPNLQKAKISAIKPLDLHCASHKIEGVCEDGYLTICYDDQNEEVLRFCVK